MHSLPTAVTSGEWWFIRDGDTYAGVRPLECTNVGGGGMYLDKAQHHVILWADNYRGKERAFTDAELARLRSGFVLETGNTQRDSSFDRFDDDAWPRR